MHEAIWAPLIAAAFLAGRFFPFDEISFLRCPFHTLTSLPCLACGGTRAVMAFVRLDFGRAFAMNPLVALGAVAGSLYLLHSVRVLFTRKPWRPEVPPVLRRVLRRLAIAAVAANWVYLIAVGR